MTAPEDIIRRALSEPTTSQYLPAVDEALAALDVLLAERQQAFEEMDKALREKFADEPYPNVADEFLIERAALVAERDSLVAERDFLTVLHEKDVKREAAHYTAEAKWQAERDSLVDALERLATSTYKADSESAALYQAEVEGIARAAIAAVSQDRETPAAAVHEPAPRGWHQFMCRDNPTHIAEIKDTGEATESPFCRRCSKPMVLGGYREAARVPAPPPARACLAVNPARFGERCVLPGGHVEPCEFPAPPPAPDICANPYRQDKQHSWRFDGDDPYIWCGACGTRRDALTGRNLPAPPQETADE